MTGDSKFDRDLFFINHRRSLRAYFVYGEAERDEDGGELLYAEGPLGLGAVRNITFYEDESKQETLFDLSRGEWTIRYRSYAVRTAQGEVFAKLFRDRLTTRGWDIADAGGVPIAKVRAFTNPLGAVYDRLLGTGADCQFWRLDVSQGK